ncbi:ABC transporter substrate-binding protein [Streptomyces mutabilis]|uniref:ABC transporter substrate-binding protein n=1 Tax=Streptomyces TaxID=1883 RepID=UPI000A230A43|nr:MULTISPECIES: ABC transporter substrate-binding protein [unclassified Streptomyces]MDG9692282.1 ABC transporter substrate-binding protein [Streptomyces sp. DH17]OSC65712.1 peptide ABC transporter substrate-binding protein [Streptomyces sp. 4F]MDN3248827.1 ABC transporter substrate-binding protein [Streptomyces sp. ZSW22]MDN3257320.1 ABC transporter substrate-binding protein [Streptomyces sp. MA25(2023)]MDQ0385195.1 peptide/nickel transport system substrate-binding protein [Streptomyces sp. 
MTTQRTSGRRKQALAAAAVVAALLTTAACGGGGDDSNGGSKNGAPGFDAANNKVAQASAAKKGGTLKFASSQDADSWDTTRGYYGFMWNFSRYYSRQLVTNKTEPGKAGAEVTPDLATGLAKVSDDGKTYTYTLRDGITWEDGKPITSKDVKYGIERVWAQDVLSGGPTYLKEVLDPKDEYQGPYKDKSKDKLGLKAIETPDDKTIVFKLPEANSDFEEMLALTSASPVRQDKDTKSKYGLRPFSSGPYKFESYNPGKDLTLVRNTEWKQESDPVRKAYPDKITIKFFSNANDLDARLIAGDYDLDLAQTGLSPQGRTTALKEHKANLDNPVSGYIRYATFAQNVKPFDNIHCRKAMLFGADHVSLQTARGGPVAGGDIGTNMLPPSVPGSEGQKYDPYGMAGENKKGNIEKAKEELKACGKPNGFKSKIAVRNNKPVEVATAESMQASLKKVGIDLEIEQYDGSQYASVVGSPSNVAKKGYGVIIMGWGPDFPSVQGYGLPLWHSDYILDSANNNFALIKDKEIDGLFADYLTELDDAGKAKIATEINHKVMEGAYYLPFVFEKFINWRSDNLANVYTTDGYSGMYDFVNLGLKNPKK